MCWSQQLFDAMIHVYNRGLNDYTTPLLELLLQLRAVVKRGKSIPGISMLQCACMHQYTFKLPSCADEYMKIGLTLLVYIR